MISTASIVRVASAILFSLAWVIVGQLSIMGGVAAFMTMLLVLEAIDGKQKLFARLAVFVFIGNALLVAFGVYAKEIATFVMYVGLLIVALMLIVRLHHKLAVSGNGGQKK